MTTTKERPAQRPRADIMHDVEARHFGRCIDQVWGGGRLSLIELMEYPKARCTAVIVKRFESAVPKEGSGKPWPDLIASYIYVPVEGDDNTWAGLERTLEAFEASRTKVS